MRISISNIAWDPVDDDSVAALLRSREVDAIDLAPSKYLANFPDASPAAIAGIRGDWADRGMSIIAIQSLMYGTVGLNLFGSSVVQEAMLNHLGAVCRLASGLGAKRLVFGSPKNRDRGQLSEAEAEDVAVNFFARLATIASDNGVVVCLEANAPSYGCNFMTTTESAAHIVQRVAHPAIRLQFDSGTIIANGEDPAFVVNAFSGLVGHIHASEPGLAPLGVNDHSVIATSVRSRLEKEIVSIEMLCPKEHASLTTIAHSLDVAIGLYRRNDLKK